MATLTRQAYGGTQRKLIIAIDVGTTFSGVSYALLDPGKVPQIQPVTQFLGQREPRGDSKVPSVVCYDPNGNVVAVGAETDEETNPALAEMDDVVRVEWFKLHLRPPHLTSNQDFELRKLRSLPSDKTPVQVFGDFLSYLFRSTKQYIKDSEIWSWDSVARNIDFVLSHPNGWEGKQQSQMREAAVAAGLAEESEALDRITFVTEGEASLHFCLNKDPSQRNAQDGIMVVDCGGGTIDVSSYTRATNGSLREITSSECVFQGSIFITCRAQEFFKIKLRNSKYESDYDVEAMARSFDKVTKSTFSGPNTPYYVKFGGLRDNDPEFDIRSGSLKITGPQVASFFDPAIRSIIQVIDNQRTESAIAINTVFLVGGFARSNYLFSCLNNHFSTRGVSIIRSDTTHLNKAVADGAVSYYLDHYVSARVAKYSYGMVVRIPFDATDPEHLRRQDKIGKRADGTFGINGVFSTILKKNTTVSERTEFRSPYCRMFTPEEFTDWDIDYTPLTVYRGQASEPPKWVDLEPDSFYDTCTIKADIRDLKSYLMPVHNRHRTYYQFTFDVVILFGHTELKAYVSWKENGIEKRSPAVIVYDN